MSVEFIITIASSVVAILFGVLTAMIGWLGSRMINQLDNISSKVDLLEDSMYEKINAIENRVIILETRIAHSDSMRK